jgi:hypothetical protein
MIEKGRVPRLKNVIVTFHAMPLGGSVKVVRTLYPAFSAT